MPEGSSCGSSGASVRGPRFLSVLTIRIEGVKSGYCDLFFSCEDTDTLVDSQLVLHVCGVDGQRGKPVFDDFNKDLFVERVGELIEGLMTHYKLIYQ